MCVYKHGYVYACLYMGECICGDVNCCCDVVRNCVNIQHFMPAFQKGRLELELF